MTAMKTKKGFSLPILACLLAAVLSPAASVPLLAQSCPLQNRFDQCIFLTTHNAFANWKDGWLGHAQQGYNTVSDQLDGGVRGLMLDTYAFDDPANDRDVYLCHEDCRASQIDRPGPLRRLEETLEEIRVFLEENPAEVVTLIFESYVGDDRWRLSQAFRDSGTEPYLFFPLAPPANWSVDADGWPTIQWMVETNKRLVVLSSESGPFPYQWDYTVETVYGNDSLDGDEWCRERDESQALQGRSRSLYVMNHFPTFQMSPEPVFAFFHGLGLASIASGISYAFNNRYDKLHDHVDACRDTHPALPTFPNFLAVDFYDVPFDEPGDFVRDQVNGAPVMQGLLTPANGLATNDTRPALTWNPALDPESDALTYTLQIDDDEHFGSPVIQQGGLGGTSFIPGAALADSIYFWHVRACDGVVGCGPYSPASRFQIDTVPPMARLIRPNGGEILPASGPSFFDLTWTCADNAGGSGLPGNPVTLAFSLDGGATFPYLIATHEANDGLFSDWDTPTIDSSALSVLISCADNAGNVGTDASDASVTVLTGQVFMNDEIRILILNPGTGKLGLSGENSLALCSGVGASQKPNGLIVVPDRECPEKAHRRIHVLVNKVGGPADVNLNEPGPGAEKLTLKPVF